MFKKFCLSMVLTVLMVLSSGCEQSIYMKEKAVREKMEASQTETPVQTTQAPALPTYSKQEISQMAAEMKKEWQAIDQKTNSMEMNPNAYGVKRYSESKVLKKVEVAKGTYGATDFGYDRTYYYNDKGMFFVKTTDGTKTMRFYFHGGRLIRWLDAGNKAIDQGSENQEFDQYHKDLIVEATQLWNDFEEEKIILNYYVQ